MPWISFPSWMSGFDSAGLNPTVTYGPIDVLHVFGPLCAVIKPADGHNSESRPGTRNELSQPS